MKRRSPETVRFICPPDMPYVNAVRGTGVTNEFHRHAHEKLCIGIVRQGARVISQAGMSEIIPENALFVINPGMAHTCKPGSREGHDYLALCIDTEKIKDIASQISGKAGSVPYFAGTLLYDTELTWKIRHLFSLLTHPDPNPILARESAFVSMLSTLMTHHGDRPPAPRRMGSQQGLINRVRDFIKMHHSENLSLDQLAEVASLSSFHFQRLFLKSTGVSPHDYLMQCRIEKARELLLKGYSIASVALDTGFVDQSHFSRSFKRVIGTTPGRYLSLP